MTAQPTTLTPITLHIRPFTEGDYARHVAIANANFPEYRWTEEEIRHHDAHWEHDKYFLRRVVAENDSGHVIAVGEIHHMPHEFHPQKYWLDIMVDPAVQHQGVGTTLYEHLLTVLDDQHAIAVRSNAKESMAPSVRFLTTRGFQEVQRAWESRLDVPAFDFQRFAGAEPRLAEQGLVITTLGAEQATNPDALRLAHELDSACMRDVPSVDPITPTSYEHFAASIQDDPNYLPDAFFIAKDGDRYIALSALWRSKELPDVLYQGLTGVLRDYRGRGVAMALKVHGVRYAAEHTIREIRTWNDTRNRPMLRINEAMGFAKQPVWITYEKALTPSR